MLIEVSIIMCVYNENNNYLKEVVESVLNQINYNYEFIIIDDSENKNVINYLIDISKRYNNIIYKHNAERLGFVKSLNKGLKLAQGKYIARVDSDDIQKSNRFIYQTEFLNNNRDIGIVGSWVEKIDDNGKERGIRKLPSGNKLIKIMMITSSIYHGSIMIRREAINILGGYNEEFEKAEDYELWMRAITRKIRIENIQEPLVKYRVSNITKRGRIHWKNHLKIKLQYYVFDYLFVYRIFGILILSIIFISPQFVKKWIYFIYNKFF